MAHQIDCIAPFFAIPLAHSKKLISHLFVCLFVRNVWKKRVFAACDLHRKPEQSRRKENRKKTAISFCQDRLVCTTWCIISFYIIRVRINCIMCNVQLMLNGCSHLRKALSSLRHEKKKPRERD